MFSFYNNFPQIIHSAGGFGLWYPELTNRISNGHQQDMGICEMISSSSGKVNETATIEEWSECVTEVNPQMHLNNMGLGAAHILGFFVLALGLNKISLKTTLSAMLFLGCFCGLLLQHITNGVLLLGIFVMFILTMGVSISLVNATAVDLFSTNLRGMAIAMSILVGRMGTVTGANSIGFLLDMNCGYTFYAMGLLALGRSCNWQPFTEIQLIVLFLSSLCPHFSLSPEEKLDNVMFF